MMPEAKAIVLKSWRRIRNDAYQTAQALRCGNMRMSIPFLDDSGVMCRAIYDGALRRFIEIEVPIASEGIMPTDFGDHTTAFCDKYKIEIIKLRQ